MQQVQGIPSIVKLNVGAHYFTASLETLTKDPNSKLAAMFSSESEMKPSEDGAFFIDRDGTHFRFILNYLRTGKLTLPEGATFIEELKEEAEFYQIQGLVEEFNKSVLTESLTTVKLNVGGHYFTTSLQTLTKDPNSMLAAMFSGKFNMKPAEDGAFFIDRDGTHFRFILNYLRIGKLTLPKGATFLEELEEEAKFYQIQGIIDELSSYKPAVKASKPFLPFQESEILTDEEHRRILKSWLPPEFDEGEWRLLFRASRDGFATKTFHSKCDNKGPTITIVKSGNNIFGGFTEVSWQSQGIFQPSSQAFLFSMVNPVGLEPTKMPLMENKPNAIYCDGKIGPSFGGGSDLRILKDANMSPSSYSYLGHTYKSPPGQRSSFFTGDTKFTVENYEVFELH